MVQRARNKITLAKIETTYGVDAGPTGANAILATNVQVSPMEGGDVSRDLDTAFLGADGTVPTELHQRMRFRVELQGSGTPGTPPGWGVLMRACACAEVIDPGNSVTYNPISDGHESITFYHWVGDTLYAIPGGRGTVNIMVTAQAIPYLEFDFTGLYSAASGAARVTPDVSTFQKPNVGASANTPVCTVDGETMVLRSMTLNLGNDVQGRFLIGAESIIIVDRSDALEAVVQAVDLATFNPYSRALAQDLIPIRLQHGTEAGKIVTLDVPAAQMQRPQGLQENQDIVEWPLNMVPLPTTGNDQWTLELT